jgi:hypothetical protein
MIKIKINKKENLNESILLEMPHIFIDEMPDEFIKALPDDIRDLVKDTEAIDFAFERYPKIDSLKGKLTGYPKKFYIDLGDKTFLVDDTGDVKIQQVEEKDDDVVTLPDNWYDAFLYRLSLEEQNEPRTGKKKKRWSMKYKRKINCSNPSGFSQINYCKRQRRGGSYKS